MPDGCVVLRHLRWGVRREVPLLRLVIASAREHRGAVVRPVAAQHRSFVLLRSFWHSLPVVANLVAVDVAVPRGGDEEVGDGRPRQRGDAVVGRVRHLEVVVRVRHLRRLRRGRRAVRAHTAHGAPLGLPESAPHRRCAEPSGCSEGHRGRRVHVSVARVPSYESLTYDGFRRGSLCPHRAPRDD